MDGFTFAERQTETRAFDNGDMVPTGEDSAWHAEFHMARVPNFEGTDYTEVPHLRLRLPGDNNRVYDQPVIFEGTPTRPSDPERFPRQWAAFQRGQNGDGEGTLITDWEDAEPGDIRRLEMLGIKTVEQLAHVSDGSLISMGVGARALRDQARRTLTKASRHDPEKEELRARADKLEGIVEGLLAMLPEEQRRALTGNAERQPEPEQPAKGARRNSAA